MTFVHDDPAFEDLLGAVTQSQNIAEGLIEKDYWVTHCLWAMNQQGFDIWFKGGTSLSKGFNVIERFSEDLDLKIEPGSVVALPKMAKKAWDKQRLKRQDYYEALKSALDIPGVTVELQPEVPKDWKNVGIHVKYPVKRQQVVLKPFVLIEAGNARVVPCVQRSLSSFMTIWSPTTCLLTSRTIARLRSDVFTRW